MNKKLFLIPIISLFICFLSLEILLRIFRPQPVYSQLLLLTGEQYSSSDFIPFTLKKSYTAKSPSQEFFGKYVTISTNSLGLRGRETTYDKPKGIKRILVLGDSYTFGVYVENNETYPAVLEEELRAANKNVEVINCGYADGFNPDEHYVWLINEGWKFKPDIVIYGFFIGNDIDNVDRKYWRDIGEDGLPRCIVNSDIYIDDAGRLRSKKNDEKTVGVEYIYKIPLLRESHFAVWLGRRIQRMSNGNLGWGRDPFPFILKQFSDDMMRKKEEDFLLIVKGMDRFCRDKGVEFVVAMIPINFQVESDFLPMVLGNNKFEIKRNYFSEFKTVLDNIKYVDLLEEMKNEPGHYFPDNGEVHFNPSGHRFVARRLKLFLDKQGIF